MVVFILVLYTAIQEPPKKVKGYQQDPRIELAREVTYSEVKASLQKEGWSEAATNRAALACSLAVFKEVDTLTRNSH